MSAAGCVSVAEARTDQAACTAMTSAGRAELEALERTFAEFVASVERIRRLVAQLSCEWPSSRVQ